MAGPGSAAERLVPNLETGERVLWIYGASCAGTSAVFICRRFLKPKGRDGRTEGSPQDNQGCEVWALPKRQGWVMYTSQSISIFSSMAERLLLVRKDAGSNPAKCIRQSVYGFRKENQLIVLQYEHLWRPQAKIRESIK